MNPIDFQPPSVYNKAYWNFTREDWVDWLNSFKTLPLIEYNKHIGNVIDLYAPDMDLRCQDIS